MSFNDYFNDSITATPEEQEHLDSIYGNDTLSYIEAKETFVQILSDLTAVISCYELASSTKSETIVQKLYNKGLLNKDDRDDLTKTFATIDGIIERELTNE